MTDDIDLQAEMVSTVSRTGHDPFRVGIALAYTSVLDTADVADVATNQSQIDYMYHLCITSGCEPCVNSGLCCRRRRAVWRGCSDFEPAWHAPEHVQAQARPHDAREIHSHMS